MIKKGALTGLLLFGIFFGAGNLIFPPTLGALSGEHFRSWNCYFNIDYRYFKSQRLCLRNF